MKKEKNWEHVGGGCWVTRNSKHPCDDTYEHQKTKERVTVYSTKNAHFEMPRVVRSISDLFKRGLVVKTRKMNFHPMKRMHKTLSEYIH